MRLKAHAKINYSLSVLGVRADGYHSLDMLLQSVALHDDIVIEPGGDRLGFSVEGGGEDIPADRRNLACRAALLLQEESGTHAGARIHLRKNIPSGAGLGGGSADAAAVLCGLNALWALGLSGEALAAIGLRLGADVPFCLTGGLARVRGIGEELEPLPIKTDHSLVIVQPGEGLATPAVYQAYDRLCKPPEYADNPRLIRLLESGDQAAFFAGLRNALQPAAEALRPEIGVCVRELQSLGAEKAVMTGSGSAVVGFFASEAAAARAAEKCAQIWERVYLTYTIPWGITKL